METIKYKKYILPMKTRELFTEEVRKSKIALMSWLTITLFLIKYDNAIIESVLFLKFDETKVIVKDLLPFFLVVSIYHITNYLLTFFSSHKSYRNGLIFDADMQDEGNEINIHLNSDIVFSHKRESFTSFNEILKRGYKKPYLEDWKTPNHKALPEIEAAAQHIKDNILMKQYSDIDRNAEDLVRLLDIAERHINDREAIESIEKFNKEVETAIIRAQRPHLIKPREYLLAIDEFYKELHDQYSLLEHEKQSLIRGLKQTNHLLDVMESNFHMHTKAIDKYFESSSLERDKKFYLTWQEWLLFFVIPTGYSLFIALYFIFK